MKTRTSIILAALALTISPAVIAAAADHQAHHEAAPAKAAAQAPTYTDGEVRRIDKAANTVTIKHGPMAGMPGMTMTFPVMQAGALDKLKVGDKVRFVAEDRSGNTVVTRIEPAR